MIFTLLDEKRLFRVLTFEAVLALLVWGFSWRRMTVIHLTYVLWGMVVDVVLLCQEKFASLWNVLVCIRGAFVKVEIQRVRSKEGKFRMIRESNMKTWHYLGKKAFWKIFQIYTLIWLYIMCNEWGQQLSFTLNFKMEIIFFTRVSLIFWN